MYNREKKKLEEQNEKIKNVLQTREQEKDQRLKEAQEKHEKYLKHEQQEFEAFKKTWTLNHRIALDSTIFKGVDLSGRFDSAIEDLIYQGKKEMIHPANSSNNFYMLVFRPRVHKGIEHLLDTNHCHVVDQEGLEVFRLHESYQLNTQEMGTLLVVEIKGFD